MASRKTLTKNDEVRELTAEDFAQAVPFSALPEAEQQTLCSIHKRGRQKAPRKVPVSIRLSGSTWESGRRADTAGSTTRRPTGSPGWNPACRARSARLVLSFP